MSLVSDLGPACWDEYIGQSRLKAELRERINASRIAVRPLEHLLLYGTAGTGKTALAMLIAQELEQPCEVVQGSVSLNALEYLVEHHDGVLVIDELQQAGRPTLERLKSVLEHGYWQSGDGHKIKTGWLTVIGTTTDPHRLDTALFSRFVKPIPDPYTEEDLQLMVLSMAGKAGVPLEADDARRLARASRGVPRLARQFVATAQTLHINGRVVTADSVLSMCRTDDTGLDAYHDRYLAKMAVIGGNAGLDTMAMLLDLPRQYVEEIERLLLERGFIRFGRGNKGRELTPAGKDRVSGPRDRSKPPTVGTR